MGMMGSRRRVTWKGSLESTSTNAGGWSKLGVGVGLPSLEVEGPGGGCFVCGWGKEEKASKGPVSFAGQRLG